MSSYHLLSQIQAPQDLKRLSPKELPLLAEEIREFLIENVTKTGGHLASNLGVVELTIALHRVFDSPDDRMIWDVGHQSYVHKLLTGRRDEFSTLRQSGGLCGFTKREESPHDPFGAGHSSTALSAALGFAEADLLKGEHHTNVAVIGDGAFTGGMVHEALNNCRKSLPVIVVLNENEMSISRNIGAFARYLTRLRSKRSYYFMKRGTTKVLMHLPLIGKPLYRMLSAFKVWLKRMIYGGNYYEDLGFSYMGPINGHDLPTLELALREAKRKERCVLLHIKTQKGKGYAPAEENPDQFHSVYTKTPTKKTFQEGFGEAMLELAKQDESVCATVAAMGSGTGLDGFAKKYSNRFFDVGIAEEHAVTFAAGLAAAGLKPFVAVYSTFFQRAYDQILHDVALQNLPVRFVIDRAGLALGDGPTHHGIFDVAFMSECPNLTLYAPATIETLRVALWRMHQTNDSPSALRYPNGEGDEAIAKQFYLSGNFDQMGVATDFGSTMPEAVVLTYGTTVYEAQKAQAILKEKGITLGIVLIEQLTPYALTAEKILAVLPKDIPVFFLEEGVRLGGAGMNLFLEMSKNCADLASRFSLLAIENPFNTPKTPINLREFHGISASNLVSAVEAKIQK